MLERQGTVSSARRKRKLRGHDIEQGFMSVAQADCLAGRLPVRRVVRRHDLLKPHRIKIKPIRAGVSDLNKTLSGGEIDGNIEVILVIDRITSIQVRKVCAE